MRENNITSKAIPALLSVWKCVLVGVCFGYWQHTFLGGVCAAVVLNDLENICWAIEYCYRGVNPEDGQ